MSVTRVDFIGRWVEAAPDDYLKQKVSTCMLEAKAITGKNAHLMFNVVNRCNQELKKRAKLYDPTNGPTAS